MNQELRIVVAGSRNFDNYELLANVLKSYLEDNTLPVTIVSGTARGADTLGEQFARFNGYNVVRFPANWNTFGRRAGYIRNAEMAKYATEEKGVLFAFWDGISRGTKHMIDLAERYGLEIHVINF